MSCDISFSELLGWKMGFEPTTLGTTILYSNRLSYIHHLICFSNRVQIYTLFSILQNFQQLKLQKITLLHAKVLIPLTQEELY